jgi:parvulin-like peptidyl-prolyl isomerase
MIAVLKRFLGDPLTHFLAVGGLLFAVFYVLHPPSKGPADANTIVVDRATLLTFMQYESAAFDPNYFDREFAALSPQEKQALVDKYVREEALFREANALGLKEGDYVIRRRMVQKMLYLIDDTASESFSPNDDQLQQYFEAHADNYRVAPSLTFTHVFVDSEVKHPGGAEKAAEKLKEELQAKGAAFDDAPKYGDRYPYGQNYVKMTPDYVVNQLGSDFAQTLMALTPSDREWQGPIKSRFGYHIVMLTEHKPSYLPKLAEVRDQVKNDMLRDTVDAYQKKAVQDLIAQYKVKIEGLSLDATKPGAQAAK